METALERGSLVAKAACMIVMINGSFGVGKTTVANILRNATSRSAVYDPEWAGFVLMRLPSWIRLKGSRTDDFQDIALWRRSVVAGTKLYRRLASGPVIVPMTFSRRDYFDDIVSAMGRLDAELRVFCLRASPTTIKNRLLLRGAAVEGPGSEWLARRVRECVNAHHDPHFGEPVDTEGRSACDVAEDILQVIAPADTHRAGAGK